MSYWKEHATAPLSREEETALAWRFARTGDRAAQERLLRAHLRLVLSLASKYARAGRTELADLIQEGCMGLVEAIRRFDPARNVRLATYASWWIRAFILRYEMENARVVSRARSREGRRAFLRGELPPREVSLDAPLFGDIDAPTLGEMLPDCAALPVDELADRRERVALVAQQIAALWPSLDGRERAVLRERIASHDPAPLRVFARRYGISGERVRQVEAEVVSRIRTAIERAPAVSVAA
jgi:RNA polymerase sigma-32 factor